MAIIIGAKYDNGVVVGYDTINLAFKDGKYEQLGDVNKFRQIKTNGKIMGAGMSGQFNMECLSLIEKEINNNGNIAKGINSFLEKSKSNEYESLPNPCLGIQFLFGDADGIRIGDMIQKIGFRQSYAGIGHRYYPAVEQFMHQNHNPKASFDYTFDLVKRALDLSKEENLKDPGYPKGKIIKGMGLVRITNDEYVILQLSRN